MENPLQLTDGQSDTRGNRKERKKVDKLDKVLLTHVRLPPLDK